MALSFAHRLKRLNVRTGELLNWREDASVPLQNWTFDGGSIAIGDVWPQQDGTVHFGANGVVPAGWDLADVRLTLNVGGESLITLEYEDGSSHQFGLDPYHQEFGLKAGAFKLTTDSVARRPFGVRERRPVLTDGRISKINWPLHRLHLLLVQVAESLLVLEQHDVAPHMLDIAEKSLRRLDWPTETDAYVKRIAPSFEQQKIWNASEISLDVIPLTGAQTMSVVESYDWLLAQLNNLKKRFPPQGSVAMSGHAHIDLAWLWPYDETRRKVRRTFHTVLSLMENSKDFRFNQSTAAYYAQIEEDDPKLLEQIVERSSEGVWETLGGMWVEPDTNMPTGESLVRQLLYGQRYFEKKFGVQHTVCWLPDCFGFSPALPQLLRQAGIDSFFTYKVNWSETNKFPHDLFWWEGLDGSKVLTHTFYHPLQGYNGFVRPDGILPTWDRFIGKDKHPETLLSVGYGDGGGGPTAEMVERERQLQSFPALPEVRWTRVDAFFDDLHETAKTTVLPTWSGEIYLEYHRATLTTQSNTKRLHRHAERGLITAETLASLGHLLGAEAPASLEEHWRTVLKNEFHDILPGSSIREVYEDAESELGEVLDAALGAQEAAMQAIAAQIPCDESGKNRLIVVNSSLTSQKLNITLNGVAKSTDDVIPPLGVSVLDPEALTATSGLSASVDCLENAHLKVSIGKDGTINSLIHKASGREALAGRGNQLWIYPNDKPREYDAWDIEEDYAETGIELGTPDNISLIESGPHRAIVRVEKHYRASTIVQDIVLTANGKRVDFETRIDWRDRRVLLRAQTPVGVRSRHASFECAHGVIERATHDNTSWEETQFEVTAHRFVDLSEPGFGVAMLNNAKYGHSIKGNLLGLSLVRGAVYPDPFADEGEQSFTYSLMPHVDGWEDGGVRGQADDLNQPLLSGQKTSAVLGQFTPINVDGIPVALSGLKGAEDGDGIVLRVFEPTGRRGKSDLVLADGWYNAGSVSLLEGQDGNNSNEIMPFEVRSWLIKPA